MSVVEDSRKRNMERRRETSRYAARDRRAKESDIYDDLKEVVPVVDEPTVTHVDRIALLRVAATVCRFRKNAGNALTSAPASASLLRSSLVRETQGSSPWCEESLSECLDGFILIIDADGTILYCTESISIYLGLTQTDFTGRHLRDFVSPDDYKDFSQLTQQMNAEKNLEEARHLVMRIKSVISPRGRNLNLKSALLKPVSFTVRCLSSSAGYCTLLQGVTNPAGQGTVSNTANAITKSGESPSGTFMTRHTCDMRISYVSDALNGLLKAESRSLMGASYYDLVHPSDAEMLRKSIHELLEKGHSRTPYYRLITASGALAWVLTEATTISHTTRGQKGQYIICIHHLLGQQTEEECDRGACEGLAAGTAVRVKAEPDDREYLGRQPEVMECVEFCPLIGDVDAGEFTAVAPRRPSKVLPSSAPIHPMAPTRKKSYEDVLQWLFRDQPESGAPQCSTVEWRGGERPNHRSQTTVQAEHSFAPSTQHPPSSYRGEFRREDRGYGNAFMLSSSSVQSQQYQQQPTTSPQHTLSSCFSRSCDLSSPPQRSTRSHSPIQAPSSNGSLRADSVHCAPTPSGLRTRLPSTGAVSLPSTGRVGRGVEGTEGERRTDLLSSLPPPNLPTARVPEGVTTRSPFIPVSNPALLSDVSLNGMEDTTDLSCYAPFIDHGMDMQPIGAGLPKDMSSLLDFPPWSDIDGLPNLAGGEDPLADCMLRDSPPAKRTMTTPSSIGFDEDWPSFLDV